MLTSLNWAEMKNASCKQRLAYKMFDVKKDYIDTIYVVMCLVIKLQI